MLSDLGSVNGTYAAGSRVDNRHLSGDETFCLGSLDGPPVNVWLNGARPQTPLVDPADPPIDAHTVMVPMEHTQRGLDITIGRAPDNTVVLDDPLDPTPYWLISTRDPEALAAALPDNHYS